MVKAAGGGGGRGLRVIHTEDEAMDTIVSARREAMSAFSSDQLFLEKYLSQNYRFIVYLFRLYIL